MDAILTYIEQHNPEQRQLLHRLRTLVLEAAPQVEESIKWKIPFYAYQGLLCYLNPQPSGVVLGFCKGALLSNEHGLLQGRGKEVRLLPVTSAAAIAALPVRELLQEALLLNETMRRRKNYYV